MGERTNDQTIDELRDELRALKARMATIEHENGRHHAETSEHSRRWLLTAGAGVAAAGIGAVLATPEQASAAQGGNMLIGEANSAGTAVTSLSSITTSGSPTLDVTSGNAGGNTAIRGTANAASGLVQPQFTTILGDTNAGQTCGVIGASSSYYGIQGISGSSTYPGVFGIGGTTGPGVQGQGGSFGGGYGNGVEGSAYGTGAGVVGSNAGTSTNGIGVAANCANGVAVSATSSTGVAVWGRVSAPSGLAAPSAAAVIGDTSSAVIAGVLGASAGSNGVVAANNTASAPALVASNLAGGIDIAGRGTGRLFQLAQTTTGAPATSGVSYSLGEQARDDVGQMWICVTSGTGSAATWQKVAAVAPGANGGSINMLATPTRLYDSRAGDPSDITTPKQQLQNGSAGALPLTASGQGGIPAGAIGIVGTLTITNTNGAGYLALYPTGGTVPATSNINWTATGQTVAASYTCALSSAGSVTVYNGGGPTDVILDIAGYIY